METTAEDLRIRFAVTQLKRVDVAQELGVDEPLFSRYINGRRPMPEGFAAKVLAVMDRLQQQSASDAPTPSEEEVAA